MLFFFLSLFTHSSRFYQINMYSILIFFLVVHHLTFADQWYSKSQCTQKEFANHMDIHCDSNELILIGWSHYGTKKRLVEQSNSSIQCQPSENDCIMDYTHKIAELCNGISKCEVILTQQFIHKCSDEATYLFISYQCIRSTSSTEEFFLFKEIFSLKIHRLLMFVRNVV